MFAATFLRYLLLLGCVFSSQQTRNDARLQVLYSWRYADFTYPSQEARNVATQQGLYVPQNIVILDSDYYFSPTSSMRRVFVTTPQFRTGIPATVSEVTRQRNGDAVLLAPFPNWDAQGLTNCEGPTSVYRIHIDRCGLLWILDTGRVETFTNPRRACTPKLLVYDLNNGDSLLTRYEFPDGTINDRSNLITIVTESYQNDCRDSIAYIADVNAYGLVVYDYAQGTSWRIENNFFYPFPHRGTITINRVTFDLMDGVFGLALSPPTDNPRRLFFHSLASARESWVSTAVLRNQTITQNADALRPLIFTSEDVREGQSTLEVITDNGIMIYTNLPRTALACWNTAQPFKKEYHHIIYEDLENLQFISGMKLKGNVLLITTSRLQNYIAGNLQNNDIKYRVIVIEDVSQLLKGTPCVSGSAGINSQTGGGHKPPSYSSTTHKPTYRPPHNFKPPGSQSSTHY